MVGTPHARSRVSALISEPAAAPVHGAIAAQRERADAAPIGWPAAVRALLLAGCVVVPCVFTTRVGEVFVVPKLVALWALLALALAAMAGGLLFAPSSGRVVRLRPIDAAVACFALLNLAAWVASSDREQSLYGERLQHQGLLALVLYLAFYALARISFADVRGLTLLFAAMGAGATLVSLYALVQKAGLDPVWEGFLPSGRVFSSIGQPNALAAYLVLAIPLALALMLTTAGAIRGLCLLASAGMVTALLFTFSRGGYLGFLVSLAVLLVGVRELLGARTRRLVAVGLVTVVVGGVAALAVAQPERFASSFELDADSSIRQHLDFWIVATHIALDHPLLGAGQETFPDHFPGYSHEVLPAERAEFLDAYRVESPHNVFLGVAAGAGLPALAAYLAVIAAFGYAAVAASRAAGLRLRLLFAGALAAAAGHLVTDFFLSPDLTGSWLFWMLLGATATVAGAGRVERT